MKNTYTEETKKKIVAAYKSGESVTSLSRNYNLSRTAIYSWIKSFEKLGSCNCSANSTITQKDYSDLKRHAEKLESIITAMNDIRLSSMLTLDEKIELFYEYRDKYSAKVLCEVLGISRGTYSNRIMHNREPTYWVNHREEIKRHIIKIYDKSQQRFGSDKILAILQKEGLHTSKQLVCSIMKELGIRSIGQDAKKEYSKEVRDKRNIIKRKFDVDAPNEVWVGDITQFWWNNNYYYICVIIDLFSRKVTAYKISKSNSTRLVTSTLRESFVARGKPENLIFHSDRGAQYTSNAYMELLKSYGITQSFSRSGSPYDNAVIESFFNLLKKEELHRRKYRSERELTEAIKEYIIFYNTVRPHRYNNYKSPDDAEKAFVKSTL